MKRTKVCISLLLYISALPSRPIEIIEEPPIETQRLNALRELQAIKKEQWFIPWRAKKPIEILLKEPTTFSLQEKRAIQKLLESTTVPFAVKDLLIKGFTNTSLEIDGLAIKDWPLRAQLMGMKNQKELSETDITTLRSYFLADRSLINNLVIREMFLHIFNDLSIPFATYKQKLIVLLLDEGISVNEDFKDGYTLLTLTAFNMRYPNFLDFLIREKEGNPNTKMPSGYTLLSYELMQHNYTVAGVILDTGKITTDTLDAREPNGLIPAMIALTDSDAPRELVIKLVTKENINIQVSEEAPHFQKDTILHFALEAAARALSRPELQAQEIIAIKDRFGPLIAYLTGMGAQFDIKNAHGLTPVEAAEKISPRPSFSVVFTGDLPKQKAEEHKAPEPVTEEKKIKQTSKETTPEQAIPVSFERVKDLLEANKIEQLVQELKSATSLNPNDFNEVLVDGTTILSKTASLPNSIARNEALEQLLALGVNANFVTPAGRTALISAADIEAAKILATYHATQVMLGDISLVTDETVKNYIMEQRKQTLAKAQEKIQSLVAEAQKHSTSLLTGVAGFFRKIVKFFNSLGKSQPQLLVLELEAIKDYVRPGNTIISSYLQSIRTAEKQGVFDTILLSNKALTKNGQLSEAGHSLLRRIETLTAQAEAAMVSSQSPS